ncbi:hypothetical protein NX059_000748 [Plenodomus lindquistii]|nr:hypothetical protein NX059_000748 [Plenodomus lindquistii]
MKTPTVSLALGALLSSTSVLAGLDQEPLRPAIDPNKYRAACPDYKHYATRQHAPYSEGPLELPFQRPSKYCRTFESPLVEKVIEDLKEKIVDKDLARLFENAFPNTLDTTVRWHVDGTTKHHKFSKKHWDPAAWLGPQSFIVTGDINAEWLRDSTNQLAQYQLLAKKDKEIHQLILGAINTQAEYVIGSPYCNAFQPPPPSGLSPTFQGDGDTVHPQYEQSFVFECKYELDSLAHFLSLSNQFHAHTDSTAFLTPRWFRALDTLLAVLVEQAKGTFDESGAYTPNEYRFQRQTNAGTETLGLSGVGNPLASNTGLIRSAFRPSDDATILGFLIPSNAMIAVELKRTAALLTKVGRKNIAAQVSTWASQIEAAVWTHGVVTHKTFGEVFAFEVDGYGSSILMDDANLPSLLALPLLGFTTKDDPIYINTRKMILQKQSNPYFLQGPDFAGIGGPHVGLEAAWPMSVLVQAMTSDDDDEIMHCLASVRNVSRLGVVHESVNVKDAGRYSRSWFAWANSVFAQTVLDLAGRKPHLLFGKGAEAYVL